MRKVFAVGMILLGLLFFLYVANVWFVDGAALRAAYEAGSISAAGVSAGLNSIFFQIGCFGIGGLVMVGLGLGLFLKRKKV